MSPLRRPAPVAKIARKFLDSATDAFVVACGRWGTHFAPAGEVIETNTGNVSRSQGGIVERTLVVESPHMTGDDVEVWQRTLNRQFKAWDVDYRDVGPFHKGMHFGYGHAEHAIVKGRSSRPAIRSEGGVRPRLARPLHRQWRRDRSGRCDRDPMRFVNYAMERNH